MAFWSNKSGDDKATGPALVVEGLPNKLIAREMGLSIETVKDHVAAVLRALKVSSRTQAVLAVSQMFQRGGPGPGWKPSK